MRLQDIIKISQSNLVRAKLRTFLTISAVFIGTLTLSLTNGVGNGVKAYVEKQLGNVGAENIIIVQGKQGQNNPVSTDVIEYNPDKQTGTFNFVLLGKSDLNKVSGTAGVTSVLPLYTVQVSYITSGAKKFQVTASQYIPGVNLEMAAGATVLDSSTNTITIPKRYVEPLGLGSPENAIGRQVQLGFKDAKGTTVERNLVVVGVQEQSLLGNAEVNISTKLAEDIHRTQTGGIANLEDQYLGVIAVHNSEYSKAEQDTLKKHLEDFGYNAQTLQDQIGTVGTVIDTILMVLNIFAIITLLAATFGIVNTLLMSVNERTSEIGLMKALGADRRTIFSIFAFEAASIGFWGALIGVLVSVGIGTIVSNIAAKGFLKDFVGFKLLAFPLLPTVLIIIGITILSFLAGALPALKASKLDPIKALRYE